MSNMSTVSHKEEIKVSLLVGLHFLVMADLSYAVTILYLRGLNAGRIGVLTAIPPLVSIMIQMVTGTVIDKNKGGNMLAGILKLFLLLGLAGMILFLVAGADYRILILAFVLFGFGLYSTSPLYSTLAIRYEENGIPVRYSIARGIGSFSYGVGCAVLGYVIQSGKSTRVILVGIIALICMFLICFTLACNSNVAAGVKKQKIRKGKFPVQYYIYLTASLCLFIGHFILNTYMIHLVEYLGGNNKHLGYTQLILSISEVPMAFIFPKLRAKLGIKELVLISGFFMYLKILGNAMASNLTMLMMVQLIQFLGNGLYWATSVYFVNSVIPKENQVRGQSMLFIACSGISGFLASYIGGIILEYSTLAILKETAVISGFIGMLLMAVSVMKEKKVI